MSHLFCISTHTPVLGYKASKMSHEFFFQPTFQTFGSVLLTLLLSKCASEHVTASIVTVIGHMTCHVTSTQNLRSFWLRVLKSKEKPFRRIWVAGCCGSLFFTKNLSSWTITLLVLPFFPSIHHHTVLFMFLSGCYSRRSVFPAGIRYWVSIQVLPFVRHSLVI